MKQRIEEINNAKVYFAMKKMKLRQVTEQQVFAVRIFLALQHFGVDVVDTTLFAVFYGKTRTAVLQMLHELGDKKVLTLVRNAKPGALRYALSETFANIHTEER